MGMWVDTRPMRSPQSLLGFVQIHNHPNTLAGLIHLLGIFLSYRVDRGAR